MRQISEQTREILLRLFQPKRTFDFFGKYKRNICDLLELIRVSGEPAVIPDILHHIFSNDSAISQTAVSVIDDLLHILSPKDLIWFDQYFRQRTSGWSHYNSDWNRLNPSKIKIISKFPGFQLSLLALLSFHSSGYVREEATKRLNLMDNGREITFILLRLNDWVDQVRAIAATAIERRITKRHASYLLSNIYLISALARYDRYDHSFHINSIHNLIRNSELKDAIKKALLSDDIYVRREGYKIVLKSDGAYLIEVIEQGIKDSDIIVRNRVIKSLKYISDSTLQKNLLEKVENDPFMPNRREILNLYIELFPVISAEKLIKALFDHHPSIRYDARYYLSKKAEIDFAEKYREAIKNPIGNNLKGIISGLGETGESSDATFIANFLHHPIAKIRKASIRAIAKLSADNFKDSFLSLIEDDSPRVSKEASLALLQCRYQIIIPKLWDTLDSKAKNHVLKNTLFIISKLSKWESISYIIEALGSKNENLKKIANDYLDRWLWNFNRSFTKPTKDQREKIANLLLSCRSEIGDDRLRAIEFNMKTF